MKGEIELYNISFLILKVELHFNTNGQSQVVTESQICCSLLNNSFIKKALI